MDELPTALTALLIEQRGLLSAGQARCAGLTRAEVRWALQRKWQLVHPGVVATTTGELSDYQRLVAAQLFGGAHAVLAASTAARWHGLDSGDGAGPVRLVIGVHHASRATPGVQVRRTRRPVERPWRRGPLAIAPPPRAVVDAARLLRGEAQRALVIAALQRRLVRLDQLVAEVEAGPRQGSAGVRAAVLEASGGAWSLPEAELLDLLARSRVLPEVWANPVLRSCDATALPCPDAWIDDVGLAIQVHSRRHHLAEQDWRWTLRSHTALGAAGVAVLAFTPHDVRAESSVRAVGRGDDPLRTPTAARSHVDRPSCLGASRGAAPCAGVDGGGWRARGPRRVALPRGVRRPTTGRVPWTASRSSCCERWRSGTSASSGCGSPTSSGR